MKEEDSMFKASQVTKHQNDDWVKKIANVRDSHMNILHEQLLLEKKKNNTLSEENERLRSLIEKDFLTGLYNKRHLEEVVVKQVFREKRAGRAFSVLMIDIDYFKKVNDEFGHPVGDEVLKSVAGELQKISRPFDVVVRYGGEEFCVVVFNISDVAELTNIAERYREAVSNTLTKCDGHKLSVTVSIGACFVPGNSSMTLINAISYADKSLYGAKSEGRNCVVVSDRRKPQCDDL